MKELKIDGVFDLSDEELWQKHIEEYPQIKSWSEEKREGARKGFISGLAEGRKSEIENNPIKIILELKTQIVKLNEYARSICINRKGESECKYHWDCSDCVRWEQTK